MSDEQLVLWEQDGPVGRITLNRPDSLNAWTVEFGEQLKGLIENEAADESCRAVLITGAGRAFSSGADLKSGFIPADDGGPDIRRALHDYYHPIITGIRRLPKPVIAAVNGPAVGIGCSLALDCDLILAAESAYFGLAFVNIGLMPDGGSTLFVPSAVGKARAFQMAMLGERLTAQQALDWGLINFVHGDDTLMDEANALVEKLGERPDPLLRRDQGSPQQHALPQPRRTARPRDGAPACARAHAGLHGGRRGVRPEARGRIHRRLRPRTGHRNIGRPVDMMPASCARKP